MYLKPTAEFRSSLAFRLTIWYAVMFAIAASIAFASCYFIIATVVHQRTDEGLLEDIDELRALYLAEGLVALKEEVDAEIASDGKDKVFYRVIRADGTVVLVTDMSAWRGIATPADILERLKARTLPVLETLSSPDREYPARVAYGRLGAGDVLQIAESLEEDDDVLAAVRSSFAVTIPIILAIAGAFGWFMARKALQGVVEVTQAAIEISKGDLSRRVPETHRGDEVDRLAATFNKMLDRIQSLITGMREMTDNIAHDLRSPLARIRAVAEGALTAIPAISDYRPVAADTI
jgi:signal transduction histidine kinase